METCGKGASFDGLSCRLLERRSGEAVPVAVREHFLLLRREICFVQKGPRTADGPVLIGVVHGEQDALGTDDFKRALQIGLAPHAAGRDIKILPEVVGNGLLQAGDTRERVKAFEVEEDDLSPVAENDLQIGKPVEDAREDEANELNAGLVVPPQAEGGEGVVDGFAEAGVEGFPDGALGDLRMDVYGTPSLAAVSNMGRKSG